MKLGIFLIILGVILAIERAIGFLMSDYHLVFLLTLPIYSGIPIYFGVKRVIKHSKAKV